MAASPPRSPVAWLLVPLVAGYLLASAVPAMPTAFASSGLLFAIGAALAAFTDRRWANLLWPPLASLAALLVACGYLQFRTAPPPDWDALPPREAELELRIERMFGAGPDNDRFHGLATVTRTDLHLADLRGQTLYFSLLREQRDERWARGSRIHTVGLLEFIPADAADESPFLAHLRQAGAHFQLRRARLTAPAEPPRGFFGFCARQHDRFETFLRRGSGDSTASTANVYVAMLLGKRSELSDAQRTAFLQTGTFHLFAISGLHIGVIAFALHSSLTLLRMPDRPAAVIGLGLLLCFVGITGAAPSAVRAFLMVFFFWSARFFGRAPNPVAALANSAIFVLLLYPQQLWSPGFQLSYSVVAGILFLGLPLGRHLQEKWRPFTGLPTASMNWLHQRITNFVHDSTMMLAVSLSATLLSSPLAIHYFGLFTPGAVLLNLLLVPAAGLVIVAGLISVVSGLLGLGVVSLVFNHAGWLVLRVMETLVQASPGLPSLFWRAEFDHGWQGPFILLLLLGSLLAGSYRNWSAPLSHFVVPFLLFTLSLLWAARLTFLAA